VRSFFYIDQRDEISSATSCASAVILIDTLMLCKINCSILEFIRNKKWVGWTSFFLPFCCSTVSGGGGRRGGHRSDGPLRCVRVRVLMLMLVGFQV
jgi:hypothetical protein